MKEVPEPQLFKVLPLLFFPSFLGVCSWGREASKEGLIISGMTMPNMGGEHLAMEIKKIQPNVPIILCTGFSTRLNAENLLKTGVAKVLMKPVTMNELAVSVRRALDMASS
jgi:DNA-binding NtrC family response regulator